MKLLAILSVCAIIGTIFMGSEAHPSKKRRSYYQPAASWYSGPQHMMYVQYVRPSLINARSTQSASALVAGEKIAADTYLKAAENTAAVDEIDAAGAHAASSVAEAYPEAISPEVETPVSIDDSVKKASRDYQFEAEQPTAEVSKVKLPTPAPLSPLLPAKRYLPAVHNRKVYTDLDEVPQSPEQRRPEKSSVDSHDDDIEQYPLQYPNRRPQTSNKKKVPASTKPLPAGTFFPISFGSTNGGAIAIANSFSTGEGGSATSHAVAYGSPEAAQLLRRH